MGNSLSYGFHSNISALWYLLLNWNTIATALAAATSSYCRAVQYLLCNFFPPLTWKPEIWHTCLKPLRLLCWLWRNKAQSQSLWAHPTWICIVKGLKLCQMSGDSVTSADRLIQAGYRVEPSLFASKWHCLPITSMIVIFCHLYENDSKNITEIF